MRPSLLIATNFVREQRWPLFFLLLCVLGWAAFSGFSDPQTGAEDSLMIFRQLVVYAVVFAVFFGSSAIGSDLRSGRILTVLSKAVSRFQYLAGLLAGMNMVLGVFCLSIGITATCFLGRMGYDLRTVWLQMLTLYAACLLAASLTLLFSTFLPGLFAAVASGMVGAASAWLAWRGNPAASNVIPLYGLLYSLMEGDLNHPPLGSMTFVLLLGYAETAAFLALASWILGRRDLTTTSE